MASPADPTLDLDAWVADYTGGRVNPADPAYARPAAAATAGGERAASSPQAGQAGSGPGQAQARSLPPEAERCEVRPVGGEHTPSAATGGPTPAQAGEPRAPDAAVAEIERKRKDALLVPV